MHGLVTLPCRALRSTARFVGSIEPGVAVHPEHKLKARRAAQLALEFASCDVAGGELHIDSAIPERLGMGSSTADVVAAIRAVSAACGSAASVENVAALAVRAETASDSTMYDAAVLFAQRDGLVIELFAAPLPRLCVAGCNTEPDRPGTETLSLPSVVYDEAELTMFDSLLQRLRAALAHGDAAGVCAVATHSARISQRYLPKRRFEAIVRIAECTGALGIQVSHSGPVAGLLFDAGSHDVRERSSRAERMLREQGLPAWRYTTPDGALTSNGDTPVEAFRRRVM